LRHGLWQDEFRIPGEERENMETRAHPLGLQDVLEFPLVEALFGRRARRFSLGASLPDGPLAFTSRHDPLPLSELEQMLVLTAAAGNTGWHYMIMRHARYAPHLSNYSGAAGGRTFPSAAGFHTSEVFFTDDEGVYLFETRDAPALIEHTTDGTPTSTPSWRPTGAGYANCLTKGCTFLPKSLTWKVTTPGVPTGLGARCSSRWGT